MNYLLRDIDEDTWGKFQAKCGKTTIKAAILAFVRAVADGKLSLQGEALTISGGRRG